MAKGRPPKFADRVRLTVLFEREELERIQEIAKAEGTSASDLLRQLGKEYIDEQPHTGAKERTERP